jgi:hypothetical protein
MSPRRAVVSVVTVGALQLLGQLGYRYCGDTCAKRCGPAHHGSSSSSQGTGGASKGMQLEFEWMPQSPVSTEVAEVMRQ